MYYKDETFEIAGNNTMILLKTKIKFNYFDRGKKKIKYKRN